LQTGPGCPPLQQKNLGPPELSQAPPRDFFPPPPPCSWPPFRPDGPRPRQKVARLGRVARGPVDPGLRLARPGDRKFRRIGWVGGLDGLASAVGMSPSFHPENPLPAEGPQPRHRILGAGMAFNLSGPALVLEVPPGWRPKKRPWPGSIALVEARRRRAGADPRASADPVAGRFSVVGAALGPWPRLWFLVGSGGTRFCGPKVLAAAPGRVHGGMGGHAVLGAVAGNAFFTGRFKLANCRARGACPCALGPGRRPPPSPWERAWRLAPACCFPAVAMRSR